MTQDHETKEIFKDEPSLYEQYLKPLVKRLLVIPTRYVLSFMYDVHVSGIKNLKDAGSRYIIIANHVSILDAALLTAFLPDKLNFAINTNIANRWWMKPFLWAVAIYPVDPTKPMALKSLVERVKKGEKMVIFPEGRITVTGKTMKVYEGPGLIADKADAKIVPVYIKGAEYSHFSYLKGKVRVRWFPKISINILPARTFHSNEPSAHAGRKNLATKLYQIMTDMALESQNTNKTLFEALLEAKKQNGKNLDILDDQDFQPMSYRKLVAKSLVLGKLLTRNTEPGTPIGLLLPNCKANAAAYFGLQSQHRPAAMLNFSAGANNLVSTCKTAKIEHIWTSHKFVEAANLQEAIELLKENGQQIHYLEDIKAKRPPLKTILYGLAAMFMPDFLYGRLKKEAPKDVYNKPSTILFTSGSTGTPKGVALSHKNINTNRAQTLSVIDFNRQDKVLNALPMFHSFGLVIGTVLPIISGVRTVLYPTPLHYAIIPELIYNTNATIMFGTNTFLQGYIKKADPYDFYSVRYILAGAEKLQDSTRRTYAERFGVRMLEGYGVTEASPVISVNTPMYNKPGTVGKLLPGMEYKLEEVPGITQGGRLWVKGGNVMLGYMRIEQPGVIQPTEDGWHDTGDIVDVDDEGYFSIVGRAKRFAKIGGEMISLAAIEEMVSELWPDNMHACVRQPDPKKGESVVLVTDKAEATVTEVRTFAQQRGVSELFIPKIVKSDYEIPLLGSGKPDYMKLEKEFGMTG